MTLIWSNLLQPLLLQRPRWPPILRGEDQIQARPQVAIRGRNSRGPLNNIVQHHHHYYDKRSCYNRNGNEVVLLLATIVLRSVHSAISSLELALHTRCPNKLWTGIKQKKFLKCHKMQKKSRKLKVEQIPLQFDELFYKQKFQNSDFARIWNFHKTDYPSITCLDTLYNLFLSF